MAVIQQLDDALSNKIAAGEVVERPASIVKELVENAIDANSSQILVEIEEGGLSSIRIVDNGTGIEPNELELAFSRHATSKIKTDRDLFTICTLGFRGEALPSIASVSRVNMQTSTGSAGMQVELEGGKIVHKQPSEARKGTTIVVTDLFYNTPARLKYLKTVLTEAGHVSEVMNRMALAYPHIRFHYVSDGKTVLKTAGNGDLRQVIAQVYGRKTAEKMVPITGSSLDYELRGYIAKPELTRANRQYMSIFINGRYIRNFKLAKAIQQGFHTKLPIGRFPIAVLKLEMDPTLIDVNVHPAKLEVRLSKEEALSEMIAESIKKALSEETLIPEPKKENTAKTKSEQLSFSLAYELQPEKEHVRETMQQPRQLAADDQVDRKKESTSIGNSWSPSHQQEEEVEQGRGSNASIPPRNERVETNTEEKYEQADRRTDESLPMEMEEEAAVVEPQLPLGNDAEAKGAMPPLYPVGQMHGTYIVAQNEQGMYLIDQHAAQERIKYEHFHQKLAEPLGQTQELLVPITLELTTRETLVVTESKEKLEAVGVFLEEFGKNTFVVRSHPTWFPQGDEESTIREMVEQLLDNKRISIGELREEAAIMMSCKAAIKANRHLRTDEMFQLLETLRRCQEPYTCPHGRPVVIHFSTYELEKMFKRVM
ncbi:DNA mismatch repair protein MutL [Shouchella clausii KSM-K16]|uniref:DNA mismatch repair protein MutL n=1 Tax=Shouchella clausii (strain KSM-K16) TaxID=66692 RepID=MUTL_SHOC1|nr:DNA mismatch repair endonuclease MutL [Shouchella clausii]Q5WFY4.1 RecName: Full=DNA mismatch repair protein MutL [Shouchella clausii KSM-K16]BAD64721.1 DNA mismatch repair protein MutL [Shouchella clausii KSM-K16]